MKQKTITPSEVMDAMDIRVFGQMPLARYIYHETIKELIGIGDIYNDFVENLLYGDYSIDDAFLYAALDYMEDYINENKDFNKAYTKYQECMDKVYDINNLNGDFGQAFKTVFYSSDLHDWCRENFDLIRC